MMVSESSFSSASHGSASLADQASSSSNNLRRFSTGLLASQRDVTRIPAALHSCVARIRAEDQYLADDIVEGAAKDRAVLTQLASHVNDMFVQSPRRNSPSPLGSNARGPSPLVMLQC